MTVNEISTLLECYAESLQALRGHTIDEQNIQRLIQTTALELRQQGLSSEQTKSLKKKLEVYKKQTELLPWFQKLSINEQVNSKPHELLAKWFQSEYCSDTKKQILHVFSLYNYLKMHFSPDVSPLHFVGLGKLAIHEPEFFCAFLLWVLDIENNVEEIESRAKTLIDSRILHCLFEAHYFYISDKDNPILIVYKVLNELRDHSNISALLNLADKETCFLRAAAFNTQEGHHFKSMNIMGTYFSHKEAISPPSQAMRSKKVQSFPENTQDLEKLYELFGFEMLTYMSLNKENHRRAFNQLLNSSKRIEILHQFPKYSLSVSNNFFLWLEEIASDAVKNNINIKTLIDANPFYLFLFLFEPKLAESFPDLDINPYIKALTASIAEAMFNKISLILCIDIAQSKSKLFAPYQDEMLLFILEQALRFQGSFSDELYHDLKKLHFSEILIQSKLEGFKQELIAVKDDFTGLYQRWSERRAQVYNLLDLCPSLSARTDYPTTVHKIKAFYIEQAWMNNPVHFNLGVLLNQFPDEEDDHKRVLLETLRFTHLDGLQREIIQYLNSRKIDWMSNELLQDAIKLKNNPLLKNIVRDLTSKELNEDHQITVIDIVFRIPDFEFQKILIKYLEQNTLAWRMHLFQGAVKTKNIHLVKHILDFPDDFDPAGFIDKLNIVLGHQSYQVVVSELLNMLAEYEQWQQLILLLNLLLDSEPACQPFWQKVPDLNLPERAKSASPEIHEKIVELHARSQVRTMNPEDFIRAAQVGNFDIIRAWNEDYNTGERSSDQIQQQITSALVIAVKMGYQEIVRYLLNPAFCPNPQAVIHAFNLALIAGHPEIIRPFILFFQNQQQILPELELEKLDHSVLIRLIQDLPEITAFLSPENIAVMIQNLRKNGDWIKARSLLTKPEIMKLLTSTALFDLLAAALDAEERETVILLYDIAPDIFFLPNLQSSLSRFIAKAAGKSDWDTVGLLLDTPDLTRRLILSGKDNMNQDSMLAVLSQAIPEERLDIFDKLVHLLVILCPYAIMIKAPQLLAEATTFKCWTIVKRLLSLNKTQPTQIKLDDVIASINRAKVEKNWDVIFHWLDLSDKSVTRPEHIVDVLDYALDHASQEIVLELYKKAVGPCKYDNHNLRSLLKAVESGDMNKVKRLMDIKNACKLEYEGDLQFQVSTALYKALEENKFDIAKYFIDFLLEKREVNPEVFQHTTLKLVHMKKCDNLLLPILKKVPGVIKPLTPEQIFLCIEMAIEYKDWEAFELLLPRISYQMIQRHLNTIMTDAPLKIIQSISFKESEHPNILYLAVEVDRKDVVKSILERCGIMNKIQIICAALSIAKNNAKPRTISDLRHELQNGGSDIHFVSAYREDPKLLTHFDKNIVMSLLNQEDVPKVEYKNMSEACKNDHEIIEWFCDHSPDTLIQELNTSWSNLFSKIHEMKEYGERLLQKDAEKAQAYIHCANQLKVQALGLVKLKHDKNQLRPAIQQFALTLRSKCKETSSPRFNWGTVLFNILIAFLSLPVLCLPIWIKLGISYQSEKRMLFFKQRSVTTRAEKLELVNATLNKIVENENHDQDNHVDNEPGLSR